MLKSIRNRFPWPQPPAAISPAMIVSEVAAFGSAETSVVHGCGKSKRPLPVGTTPVPPRPPAGEPPPPPGAEPPAPPAPDAEPPLPPPPPRHRAPPPPPPPARHQDPRHKRDVDAHRCDSRSDCAREQASAIERTADRAPPARAATRAGARIQTPGRRASNEPTLHAEIVDFPDAHGDRCPSHQVADADEAAAPLFGRRLGIRLISIQRRE